jgi:hypothetical protein
MVARFGAPCCENANGAHSANSNATVFINASFARRKQWGMVRDNTANGKLTNGLPTVKHRRVYRFGTLAA